MISVLTFLKAQEILTGALSQISFTFVFKLKNAI